MRLFNFQIETILDKYSVPFYTENGRVYADDVIGLTGSRDVTRWTKKQLYSFLGIE